METMPLIDLKEMTPNQAISLIQKIKYHTDEKYHAQKDKNNRAWLRRKYETDSKYRDVICQRVKDKYANDEEYRERSKQQRRDRYKRQKEEKNKENVPDVSV